MLLSHRCLANQVTILIVTNSEVMKATVMRKRSLSIRSFDRWNSAGEEQMSAKRRKTEYPVDIYFWSDAFFLPFHPVHHESSFAKSVTVFSIYSTTFHVYIIHAVKRCKTYT